MKVGYVRVSTREQNTARQDELMKRLGVEKVYTDRMSGKSTERPELHKMMDFVREGDTLVVESISRFARNTRDLLDLTSALETKGVQFISQKESIDTSTPTGKFILTLFAALAELETRTGCMFCMFGLHLEKEPNRFQRMALTRPRQHDFCVNKLDCGKVLDFIGVPYQP